MLARLADALDPNPAYVATPWWDVLACNDAYASLIGGIDQRPVPERNILWITFTESRRTGHLVDWAAEARAMAGQFRAALGRYPDDPRGPELLEALLGEPSFRELWEEHAVTEFAPARKRLRHPVLGRLNLDYTKLSAAADDRQSLIAFLPADDETAALLTP